MFAWCWFALLPVLVPAIVAIVQRRELRGKGAYVWPTAARILGYPALFILLVGVPCFVLEIWLVPVILDAHPGARTIVRTVLAPLEWILANGFVLSIGLMLLWPAWVVSAALHAARRLRGNRIPE